jgi:hypothetical protein
MEFKSIMLRTTALILGLAMTNSVMAQCYVRQAMTTQQQASIARITDLQTLAVPVSNTHHKCIVTFRALIDNEWISGEGEKTAPRTVTETELCRQAMNSGRVQVLSRATAKNLTVETNMVCDERPEIQVRNVRIGDTVRESEVRVHPNFSKTFRYLGAQCRWFIEPTYRRQDLGQYQGIICLSHGSQWRVVDKW